MDKERLPNAYLEVVEQIHHKCREDVEFVCSELAGENILVRLVSFWGAERTRALTITGVHDSGLSKASTSSFVMARIPPNIIWCA
jgi:hypothetical protein